MDNIVKIGILIVILICISISIAGGYYGYTMMNETQNQSVQNQNAQNQNAQNQNAQNQNAQNQTAQNQSVQNQSVQNQNAQNQSAQASLQTPSSQTPVLPTWTPPVRNTQPQLLRPYENIDNFGFWDNDIKNLPEADLNACMRSCDESTNCVGISMSRSGKGCWLKTKLEKGMPTPDWDSYYIPGTPMASGTVRLENVATSRNLENGGGDSSDKHTKAYEWGSGDDNKRWSYNPIDKTLCNKKSGRCLENGGADTSGNTTRSFPNDGNNNKKWNIKFLDGNVASVCNVETNNCLENGGAQSSDANVASFGFDGNSNKKWRIIQA